MIDKALNALKYITIAALYIVFLFGGYTLYSQSNKDTKELTKEYPMETKGTNTYTGYIVKKYRNKGIPTIEVVGYGRFVISEEFKQLDVGTMVPDYIAMRSQDGKAEEEEHKTIKKD